MYISPLISLIKILLALLGGLWLLIAGSIAYRRIRERHLALIERTFAEITSHYLYPSVGEKPDIIEIQRAFRKVGIIRAKSANVQFLQDLMIRTQASLLGSNYHKLETLYTQIPPYRASQKKLKSRRWYVKARGIREIYEMDQEQYIREIVAERNNKNVFVRREAQIAMVVFLGWKSLRFLPYLKREVPLWQQIKIVEKLHDLYPVPDIQILREAYGSESGFSHELIMRIIRKFGLNSEIDYIIQFLDDKSFDTRETAIYCIASFQPDEIRLEDIKKKFFRIPKTEQQIQLIKYLNTLSSSLDLPFFKHLLYTGNDIIKLTTAEILWNNGHIEEVQEFYYKQYNKNSEKEETLLYDS